MKHIGNKQGGVIIEFSQEDLDKLQKFSDAERDDKYGVMTVTNAFNYLLQVNSDTYRLKKSVNVLMDELSKLQEIFTKEEFHFES